MTQFRIDVVVSPRGVDRGIRQVERRLSDVEQRANRVQLALRRAFGFFTLGFAVREVTRFADSFTGLQNRLRLLVPQERALVETTRDLLDVSNRTRTSFEGTVILYQRLGLATRELGVAQGDLLGVVESINQALILSGASAKEANNGLIQLSQGIASNRLGGDELRSTLEQLPAVADVIARQLGVTRGELRELGATGAITGEVIIDAFRNAREELDEQFGRTIPTLAQSFTVLRNNLTVFIGELNQGTGVLGALGTLLRFVGNNIDALVRSLGVLAAAFLALRLGPTIQEFFRLQQLVKQGRVTILGSAAAIKAQAEFQRDQAAAAVSAAAAEANKTRTTIQGIEATQASALVTAESTAQNLAAAEAEVARIASAQALTGATIRKTEAELAAVQAGTLTFASFAREKELEAQLGILRATLTGETEALAAAQTALASATNAATTAEAAQRATEAQLAGLKTQLTAQTNAQAVAEGRLATATAAANAQANIFTRTLARIRSGVSGFFALIARNPITSLTVGLAVAAASLFLFRDRIRLTADTTATLGDVFDELVSQIGSALSGIIEAFDRTFGESFKLVTEFIDDFNFSFQDILLIPASIVDGLIGLFAGAFAAIISIFLDLPKALGQIFVIAVNGIIDAIEFLPDVFFGILETIGDAISIFVNGQIAAFGLLAASARSALTGDFDGARGLAEQAAITAEAAFDEATSNLGTKALNNIADNLEDEFIPRLSNVFEGGFQDLGKNAASVFSQSFEDSNFVTDFVLGLLSGAETRAFERERNERLEAEAEARDKAAQAAAKQAAELSKLIGEIERENQLLSLQLGLTDQLTEANQAILGNISGVPGLDRTEDQVAALEKILEINDQLRESQLPELTPAQQQTVAGLVATNQQLSRYQDLVTDLEDQSGTLSGSNAELQRRQKLVAEAFLDGAISGEQFRIELERIQAALDSNSTDLFAGFRTGFAQVMMDLADLASTAEDLVIGTFDALQEALANTIRVSGEALHDFFTEGEFDAEAFGDVLEEIFFNAGQAILRMLEDILAQELLLNITEGLGSLFGGGEEQGPEEQIDEATLLAQRQTVAAQEQAAATTLQGATTTLSTGATTLQTGATTLQTATGVLAKSSAGLSAPSTTLTTAASTLLSAIPGLQAAATTLLSAAQLQLAANATSGATGAAANGTPAALSGAPILVGEEGPEIFTPGRTGSIIPNDQSIAALSSASAAQGGMTVIQAPAPEVNVSVVNVTDPDEAVAALSTPDGEQAVLNIISKNPEAVRGASSR